MSNINWNQFINNFTNGFNRASNLQNAQLNQNSLPQPTLEPSRLAQTLLPNTTAQLNQTMSELAMLSQQQTTNMIKDFLNLPKNFDQLLAQLTTNSNLINKQTLLLLLSSNLNVGQLSSLLQNNSKEAMTNLYQMLAQYNQLGVSLKEEQLSQFSKLISMVAASSTSDVQSLKTIMLMYLPWLPLNDPNAFKLEIANSGSTGGDAGDDYITILIASENYGNLQADIYKTDKDGIRIDVVSSQTFPQKDFVLLMQEESKKYSININFNLAIKEAFNKEKNEKSQIQVCMNTSPGVNPFLLLISNAVIKSVHELDFKENLREKRKEKLDNGKSQN